MAHRLLCGWIGPLIDDAMQYSPPSGAARTPILGEKYEEVYGRRAEATLVLRRQN
jgi:hypothetical protein